MGVFANSFAEGLRPARDLTVSEWAEEYLYMPANNSDAGKFSIHRAPFQKAIMDALTPGNGINEVVWMASAQTGKTFVANAFQGYVMHIHPQNILVYQPTTTLAEVYSDSKVSPMIESTPVLKALFQDKKNNGKTIKKFRDIFNIEFLGAGSGNSFRMRSAPFVIADEIDSYDSDIDGEGDPLKLIKARTTTFGRKAKLFYPSTPTIDGLSAIQKKFNEGNQQYYHVPCPHCEHKQVLKFTQLKFERDNTDEKVLIKDSIYYECEICKGKITEDKKTWMLSKGEWIASNPNAPKHIVSFHISAIYSPLGWYGWDLLIEDFLQAKDDPFLLKAFKNTRLGETYYEKSEQPSHHKLQERAENYPLYEVNEKAVVLFGGVDTQDNRLHAVVIAIGEGGETWTIANEEIFGLPSDDETWEALDRVMRRPYKHKSGIDLYVKACAIDTGGHFTNDVYSFVRRNPDKYFAIKGASHDISVYIKESNKIDIDPKTGRRFQNSLTLHIVNTILLKKYIYINLNNMLQGDKEEGSKVIHFSNELPKNFYEMLVSEKLIKKVVNGVLKEEFINPKKGRNEVLDCFVYAYAMGFYHHYMNLYSDTYKKIWDNNIGKRISLLENKKEETKEKPKTNLPTKNKSWINNSGWSIK